MNDKRPLILVVNDDGITAPGIRSLINVMLDLGEVVVVAPDSPQSGMGHAITLGQVIRYKKIKIDNGLQKDYSCTGTPADCVKLAVNKVLSRKPDLLVSGINHGSNSSINVIYSGTMSAAIEGSLSGIPSVGFSLLDYSWDADFKPSLEYIKVISKNILKNGLPKGTCLNVNIPAVSKKKLKGIKVCRQADANWLEEFDERSDPTGKTYFWLKGTFHNFDKGNDTDEWALKNDYISVVPVQFDITAHHAISYLNNWNYDVL